MRTPLLFALGALLVVAVAFVVALLVLGSGDRYRVPTSSMEPTIPAGSEVTVHEDTSPELGDVVLYHPPAGGETGGCEQPPAARQMCAAPGARASAERFIGRVVAGPGDEVTMADGILARDGRPIDEAYAQGCGDPAACDFPTALTVPRGTYLILGDNRIEANDSRFFGPVRADWIQGRVETG